MDQSENQPEQPNIPEPTIQPEIPQKSNMPAWAIVLITVLTIAVLGGGGYAAYQYYSTPEPVPVSGNEEPTDPTADWKTYRNEEYGFEVKYPEGWSYEKKGLPLGKSTQFTDINGEHVLSINNPIREIGYENLSLVENSKIRIPNTDEYFDKTIYKSGIEGEGLILVLWNLENFKLSGEISISYKGENDPNIKILDQILSTFKFIEVDDSTANWQTYKNSKYGFEVKIPNDWDYLTEDNTVCFNSTNVFDSCIMRLIMNEDVSFMEERYEDEKTMITMRGETFVESIITVDSTEGKLMVIDSPSVERVLYLNTKDYLYDLVMYTGGESLFNQIISTFKFIE